MSAPNEGVAVLRKAGKLLEVLAFRGPQTVAQLADATGEPRTTIYRLIGSMRDMGWIEEGNKRGRYALGVGLLHLGRGAMDQDVNRLAALPVLRALRDESGLTVYLTVVRGLRAVCIERLDGQSLSRGGMQIGGSLPLHAGAGPQVLLANGDQSLHERWWQYVGARGQAPALTSKTPVSPGDLEAMMRRVRANGYSVSSEDNVYGLAAIGAPIRASDGRCVAAVSVSTSPGDLADPRRLERLISATRRAAQSISDIQSGIAPDYPGEDLN